MKRAAAHAATAVLIAGIVSACGSSPASTTPSQSSTTPSRSASAAARPGWQFVTARTSGIRFQVPADWVQLKGASVSKEGGYDAVARRMHMSVEQVKSIVSRIEVFAAAPNAVGGFTENVDEHLTALFILPTGDALRRALPALGMRINAITSTSTPIGAAVEVDYFVPNLNAHGIDMYVTSTNGVVELAVNAHTAAAARSMATEVLGSLSNLGGS